MTYTPGHALFLRKTGHSIHNERPNFLARHVADFIEPAVRGISMDLDVARTGARLKRVSSPSPAACRDRCRRTRDCRAYNYTRAGRLRQPGSCALLRSAGRRKSDPNAVSGVK